MILMYVSIQSEQVLRIISMNNDKSSDENKWYRTTDVAIKSFFEMKIIIVNSGRGASLYHSITLGKRCF